MNQMLLNQQLQGIQDGKALYKMWTGEKKTEEPMKGLLGETSKRNLTNCYKRAEMKTLPCGAE